MVNTSLNWVSLVGILLFLYGIPAVPMGVVQLYFLLKRRDHESVVTLIKAGYTVFKVLGRLTLMPSGAILFFQGWRLDPILQFVVTFLALGVVYESASSFISEYYKFRSYRKSQRSNSRSTTTPR